METGKALFFPVLSHLCSGSGILCVATGFFSGRS